MKLTLLKRNTPFYIAAICAMAVVPLALWLVPQMAVQATANTFFVIYLALEFYKIEALTAQFLQKHAAGEDEPAWLIVAVAFCAVLVAVGSLFALINGGERPTWVELTLSLASVALGWMTIHTMAAHHYAHLYWRPEEAGTPSKSKKASPGGGLDFPGDKEPCGFDFLYFSLVTGMTAQTSDVAITQTDMRKLNLLHAVVSFFFNTVLVASAVNVAVTLAS